MLASSFLGACSKEDITAHTPDPGSVLPPEVAQLEQTFLNGSYAGQLRLRLPDSTYRHWEPQWQKAVSSTREPTSFFVPLTMASVQWSGVRKYLFIRRTATGAAVYEATYLFSEVENRATTARAFFAAFTGMLRLRNLATGQEVPFFYQRGQRQLSPLAVTTPGGSRAKAASCYSVVFCDWTGYCASEQDGSYAAYGCSTYGINYCQSPSDDGVGCSRIMWSLTRSNSVEHCSPDNPPPDPGTPSDPGDPAPPIQPKTPCQVMQTAARTASFQAAVGQLKYLSNNPPRDADGKPLETGITFLDPVDNSTYVTSIGTETNVSMNAAAGGLLGGSLHNHPPGDGTLPLFSPGDLYSIYLLLISSPPGIDPTTYTETVIIHNGQSYMLTITDPTAFIAFGARHFSNQRAVDYFVDKYYNEKQGGIGSSTIGINGNEKIFLGMLKREDMGLALFKQNASDSTWQQLALNSTDNTVSSIPCP